MHHGGETIGYTKRMVYTVQAFFYNQAPSDSTTYLIGNNSNLTSTGAQTRIYIPQSGMIRDVWLSWNNITIDASAENTTFVIRKNNTTDSVTGYTGSFANASSPQTFDACLQVSKGDYIHIKMTCPAWATNPTGVSFCGTITVEI